MSYEVTPMICFRKDWTSIANAFEAAGYKCYNNCYSMRVLDHDNCYITWFDLNQEICYIFKYEASYSKHNDLGRPRLYHTKGPENFSRFELEDIVKLINCSSEALDKWNAWLRNYENEQAIEALP